MVVWRKYEGGVPRFVLDRRMPRQRYKTTCPQCHRKKCFTVVVDATTGQPVDERVYGICDHVNSCGYCYFPKVGDFKKEELFAPVSKVRKEYRAEEQDKMDEINPAWLLQRERITEENPLFKFLVMLYGFHKAAYVFNKYHVGTCNYKPPWDRSNPWMNCSLFWQIDKNFKVRTGKIMEYGLIYEGDKAVDVKRVKNESYAHITWVHNSVSHDYHLKQCLFGEHLLAFSDGREEIGIVESEKTALIASLEDPDRIWMATGSLQNLREVTMNVLKGRHITLYPDKGKANKMWRDKVRKDLPGYDIKVEDFIERQPSVEEGDDIADFFIRKRVDELNRKATKDIRG